MGKNKLKIYSSKKVILSEKEKKELDNKIEKEVEKYERDSKCGGLDGNNFIALHYRF